MEENSENLRAFCMTFVEHAMGRQQWIRPDKETTDSKSLIFVLRSMNFFLKESVCLWGGAQNHTTSGKYIASFCRSISENKKVIQLRIQEINYHCFQKILRMAFHTCTAISLLMMFRKKTLQTEKILAHNLTCIRSLGVLTLFMIHCCSLFHGKISLVKHSHSSIVK